MGYVLEPKRDGTNPRESATTVNSSGGNLAAS